MKVFILIVFCGIFMMQQSDSTGTFTGPGGLFGQEAKPPIAKKIPKVLVAHGDKRNDDYYWMNKREDPNVIDYLNAENEYTKTVLQPTEKLQDELYKEMLGRIKQSDTSAPYEYKGFTYFSRTEDGKQYRIYCRMPAGVPVSTQEIMLDVNELAKGHSYCGVRSVSVSTNQQILAFSVDTVGRRKYEIRFKNLDTGEMLDDTIPNVTGGLAWANDNKHIFYSRQDPQTLRSYQIYRHELGTDSNDDVLVYQEDDEEFSCFVFRSRSRKFIIIGCDQTMATEYHVIDADRPTGKARVIETRKKGHEYSVDHINGHFYIRTNWDAKNFRLMKVAESSTGREHWNEVLPHRADVYFQSYELYDDFLAVEERVNGLTEIKLRKWDENKFRSLDIDEEVYVNDIWATPDTATHWFRYSYESMTTPDSIIELNIDTGEKRIVKEEEILGGFDRKNYRSKRLWVTARDGAKVPVSLVHHVDTDLDGSAPCLLYAYGSYGSSTDASFVDSRLNLLDRGFVFAIAHIRGGQEMGRQWYEDGKLFKKKNTFTDFVDAGDALIEQKICDPKRLYARGGSAGGLLMGAVVNMRPELFHGVVADVPFVDVVTTMLDESIPLTTSEYDEWGNPNDSAYYRYMLSYSPYDNVVAKDYPNMLVTSGLHDSQVQYWEPTKWVAKLRDLKTDNNLLLLKTNMKAGHGGASGRYDRFKEIALRHAFLIHLSKQSR